MFAKYICFNHTGLIVDFLEVISVVVPVQKHQNQRQRKEIPTICILVYLKHIPPADTP